MKLEEANTDQLKGDGERFHFWMPVEVIKKSEGERIIQGIASTPDRDLQGEVVMQNGIDYGYFMKKGWINDDHNKGPEHKVGEPLECKITKKGFWVKARLYKGLDRAEHWWKLIKALDENQSDRKIGFSIEGKILRRDGKTIQKCWLTDVAITSSPVNTNTWAEIVKSLGAQQWCLHPWDNACVGGCCSCNSAKSLSETDQDLEKEDKALTTASGASLVPESLEGSNKPQTHKSIELISEADAIELCKALGYTQEASEVLVDSIFTSHGIH